jgi:hypothetical protein
VRELGLALPDVVDGTAYGAAALKRGGKLLACIQINKSVELNSIVVHIDLEQRAELRLRHSDVSAKRTIRSVYCDSVGHLSFSRGG